CIIYGFSRNIFTENIALIVTLICYVTDQLLMSVSMARATYLKKIVSHSSEVHQTLTMGVSIDHIFSISIALISGFIWYKFGYQYVFLIGGIIALINLFSTLQIKIPKTL
ncbi:MAG TPA: MFS transporter, partial [Spirochaetota bacterium]|nr:MFS transporter [Spirochaetota bacterium]